MNRPEKDWQSLKDLMDHVLRDQGRVGLGVSIVWQPPTDVYETEKELVARIDVAGVRREDIKVFLTGDALVIRGLRRDSLPPGKKHFYKMEITMGPFERRIVIPGGVRVAEVRATYRDGILEVRCLKSLGDGPGEVSIEIT